MRIRSAQLADIEAATGFLLAMLDEMASFGGYPVAAAEQAREWLRGRLTAALHDPEHLLLLAETGGPEAGAVGFLEASISQLPPVFQAGRVLHIHAVYVEPAQRRQGVARELMTAALQWGKDHACAEVELDVLVRNRARRLYERLGFSARELAMRRRL